MSINEREGGKVEGGKGMTTRRRERKGENKIDGEMA